MDYTSIYLGANVDEAVGAAYVPTLNSAPTANTTTYTRVIDGTNETIAFVVGQFCRVAKQGGGYSFYQLYDLTTSNDVTTATWEKMGEIYTGVENVFVNVSADAGTPAGTAISGLTINVYYNDASTPTTTVTTDSNGMAALIVPNGYKYRLVFPTQSGCREIADVVHVATLNQRSVEVEYQPAATENTSEHVIVQLMYRSGGVIANQTVTLTYDGQNTTSTTDSTGKAEFDVPYGKQYTITAPQITDYYIAQNAYTRTFTAAQSVRAMDYLYKPLDSGYYIVTAGGDEYTLTAWEAAVQAGTRQNSEALYIKVSTPALVAAGGTFVIDIDMVRERTYGSTQKWCDNNYEFKSVPLNGNSASAAYYYDGLTASQLIKAESVEKGTGWGVPAFDYALGLSRTINNTPCPGFIGSVGQWSVLWNNVAEIDDILLSVRPNGTYLLSGLTATKWTSTQASATNAWSWGTSAGGSKYISCIVLPFFAY